MSRLPELHANIEVVKEVPSKCHAILRGENSMDPACRWHKSTEVYTTYHTHQLAEVTCFKERIPGTSSMDVGVICMNRYLQHLHVWPCRRKSHMCTHEKTNFLSSNSQTLKTSLRKWHVHPDKMCSLLKIKWEKAELGGGCKSDRQAW